MKHKIKIYFEERYSALREVDIEMNDEQYSEYINNNHIPLDGLLKNLKSFDEFLNRYKENEEPGFSIKHYTSDDKVKERLFLESFDIDSVIE